MDFTISKDSGTGKAVISVSPSEKNNTEEDFTKILTVEASDGSKKTVTLIHRKGDAQYEYDFRVTPTELRFGNAGATKEVVIVSTRQKVINGVKVGDPEDVEYSRNNSGDVSGTGTSITMSKTPDSINDRSGVVTYTQVGSNKVIEVKCIQNKNAATDDGEISDPTYTFSITPTVFNDIAATGGEVSVAIISEKKEAYIDYTYDDEGNIIDAVVRYKTVEVGYSSISTGKVTVMDDQIAVLENEGENSVTHVVTFTQEESGKVIKVNINQKEAKIEYEYNFTSDVTDLSFIAAGETKTVTITSQKRKIVNGNAKNWEDWSYTRANSGSVSGSKTSITMGVNNSTTTEPTGTVTYTQDTSGKQVVINCKQAAKKEDEYIFEIAKKGETTYSSSVSFDIEANPTGTYGEVSLRTKKNGENFSDVTVTTDASWIQLTGTGMSTTWKVLENTTNSSRKGTITLTQRESNKQVTIVFNQAAAEATYVFTADKSSILALATPTVATVVTVTSTLNGSEHDWSWSMLNDGLTPSWVIVSKNSTGLSILFQNNTTSAARSATLTLTQADSGKTITIPITQAASSSTSEVYTITLIVTGSSGAGTLYLFDSGMIPTGTGNQYYAVPMDVQGDTYYVVDWTKASGLSVNQRAPGTTTKLNENDVVYVKIYGNNSWSDIGSFTLFPEDQEINLSGIGAVSVDEGEVSTDSEEEDTEETESQTESEE